MSNDPLPLSNSGNLSLALMRSVSASSGSDVKEAPPTFGRKTLRQLSAEKKNADPLFRIAHETNPVTLYGLWNQLSDPDHKKSAILDHFRVNTMTTRGLSDEDFDSLLRIDRAIHKKLSAHDAKDVQFVQRYKDLGTSLPPEKGGVWRLIREVEQKLSDDLMGNLWQDSMIYGLIGGPEAASLLKPKHLLLRFSLTECCLCSTMRNSKNQVMHSLYREGLTSEHVDRAAHYTLTTKGNESLMALSDMFAQYSDPAKKKKRISEYSNWHDAHYGIADENLWGDVPGGPPVPSKDSNSGNSGSKPHYKTDHDQGQSQSGAPGSGSISALLSGPVSQPSLGEAIYNKSVGSALLGPADNFIAWGLAAAGVPGSGSSGFEAAPKPSQPSTHTTRGSPVLTPANMNQRYINTEAKQVEELKAKLANDVLVLEKKSEVSNSAGNANTHPGPSAIYAADPRALISVPTGSSAATAATTSSPSKRPGEAPDLYAQ